MTEIDGRAAGSDDDLSVRHTVDLQAGGTQFGAAPHTPETVLVSVCGGVPNFLPSVPQGSG